MTSEQMKQIKQHIEIHDGNLEKVYKLQSETLEGLATLKNEIGSLQSDLELMIYNINLLVAELC